MLLIHNDIYVFVGLIFLGKEDRDVFERVERFIIITGLLI